MFLIEKHKMINESSQWKISKLNEPLRSAFFHLRLFDCHICCFCGRDAVHVHQIHRRDNGEQNKARKKCRSIETVISLKQVNRLLSLWTPNIHHERWMNRPSINYHACTRIEMLCTDWLCSWTWNEIDWSTVPITDEMETINSRRCHTSPFPRLCARRMRFRPLYSSRN